MNRIISLDLNHVWRTRPRSEPFVLTVWVQCFNFTCWSCSTRSYQLCQSVCNCYKGDYSYEEYQLKPRTHSDPVQPFDLLQTAQDQERGLIESFELIFGAGTYVNSVFSFSPWEYFYHHYLQWSSTVKLQEKHIKCFSYKHHKLRL